MKEKEQIKEEVVNPGFSLDSFKEEMKTAIGPQKFVKIPKNEDIVLTATNWRFEERKGFDTKPLILDILKYNNEEMEMYQDKDGMKHPELAMTAVTFLSKIEGIITHAMENNKQVIEFKIRKSTDSGKTKYMINGE